MTDEPTIPSIETTYNGYRFRSRTEAKWAVNFEQSRLTWEYEPEGFELPIVGNYLPDFRVDGHWVEIKAPTVLDDIHRAPGTGDGLTTGANDAPTGPDEVWALLAKPIMLAVATRAPVVVHGGMNPGSLILELQFHKGDVYPRWMALADTPALVTARSYRFKGLW